MLASAAAMASVLVAIVIVWAISGLSVRTAGKGALLISAIVGVLYITEIGQEVFWAVVGRKLDISAALETSNNTNSITLLDRLDAYTIGFNLFLEQPMGLGWGAVAQAFSDRLSLPGIGQLNGSGFLSLALDIAVAAGVVGLFFWLVFVGLRIAGLIAIQDQSARLVSCALFSVFLHHLFITEIQMPFLWFALALADKVSLEKYANN
jgi:hypothetical protein